jgi:carboxypeptidase family protein
MGLGYKIERIAVAVLLVTLCSAQERFESGWLKGFTKSPNEHVIVHLQKPFVVPAAKGIVLDTHGTAMGGVLVEIEDSAGRMKPAKTDSKGRFMLHGLHNGHFRFKVTMNGFQSVVGEIIISKNAPGADVIRVVMRLGV